MGSNPCFFSPVILDVMARLQLIGRIIPGTAKRPPTAFSCLDGTRLELVPNKANLLLLSSLSLRGAFRTTDGPDSCHRPPLICGRINHQKKSLCHSNNQPKRGSGFGLGFVRAPFSLFLMDISIGRFFQICDTSTNAQS